MMNPFDAIFGKEPPARLKVFAPNGDTKEVRAYLGIRSHQQYPRLAELFLQYDNGKIEVLNKKVVVQNQETGEVCYNPRVCPHYVGSRVFITNSEKVWLDNNPCWPAVLELWDNPVEGRDDKPMDGINPT